MERKVGMNQEVHKVRNREYRGDQTGKEYYPKRKKTKKLAATQPDTGDNQQA